MKSLCVSFLTLICAISGLYGQVKTDNLPSNLRTFVTPKLVFPQSDSNVVLLEMGFNDADPRKRLKKIDPSRIESISLAYSKYRLSNTFDQKALNMKRMSELYEVMPEIQNNTDIKWYWFEQTGCDNPETCKEYFHGFVIFLKSTAGTERKESEIALLDYYATVYEGLSDTRKMDSLIRIGKLKLTKKCDTLVLRKPIKGNKMPRAKSWTTEDCEDFAKMIKTELAKSDTVKLVIDADEKGDFLSLENPTQFIKSKKILRFVSNHFHVTPGRQYNQKIQSRVYGRFYRYKQSYKMEFKTLPLINGSDTTDIERFLYATVRTEVCDYLDTSMLKLGKGLLSHTQNTVIKVFDRNRNWKNCLVATDVTGSMFPYLAQFQMWHKNNLEKDNGNHDFIFFNDGDNLPDMLKTTGSVGGLYYIKTYDFEKLVITMKTAMLKGNGGDIPENNIEAILEGLKNNPEIKEVIMIADNNATPRDLELLSKVKVPIRLILCGTQNGINPAYLTMIRNNKGSLHTMDQDLLEIFKLGEGQSLKIEGKTYKVKNGQFVKL